MTTKIGARLDFYTIPRFLRRLRQLDFYTVKGSARSAPLETSRPSNDRAEGGRDVDRRRRSTRLPVQVAADPASSLPPSSTPPGRLPLRRVP